MSSNLFSIALNIMHWSCPSHLQADECWLTFEEILQQLHAEGIYIHSEQLAEFLLAHGLPVHLRYVPPHLQVKAIQVNENYQGDMARLIEELEPPSWDFSWMDNIEMPAYQDSQINQVFEVEEQEQPSWDYSWSDYQIKG